MSDSEDEGTTKVTTLPTFDGTAEKFQQWWTKFEGYANLNGFASALKLGGEESLPESETSEEVNKEQKKARKRNNKAVYALTMAFRKQKLQGMVYKAKTKQYPSGLAHLIVQQLKQKYMPTDEYSKVEKSKDLAQVKMRKNEDPSELVERLYTIANRYRTTTYEVPDEELLTAMIGAAPKEYAQVITQARKEYKDDLDIDKLEQEMKEYW